MFPSVDLLDESNIHSKDVSSWVEFMSYTSFAKPHREWLTEIRKTLHILERERILKILLSMSTVEDKRLQGWRFSWLWAGQTTGDCDILGLSHVQSGRSLIFCCTHCGNFLKMHQIFYNVRSTLWLEHSNDLGFSCCSLYLAALARTMVFMCRLFRRLSHKVHQCTMLLLL